MSRPSWVRRALVGALLFAVAVQIGIYFALREKKRRAAKTDDEQALASAQSSEPDAGQSSLDQPQEPQATDAAPALRDASTEIPRPLDAAAAVVVAVDETPRERRRRERREAQEEAKRGRERISRERAEEKRLAEERDRRAAAERADAGIANPAKKTASVLFVVSPTGASLNLDAQFIGKAPLEAVEIAAGRHTLAVSAKGYRPATKTFSLKRSQKRTVTVKLEREPDKADEPTVIPKRGATPRISSTSGNASSGRGLVGSKCNACHRARGAKGIGPRSRRKAAWGRFFSGGYHDRYERLGGLVSRSALTDIKAYLMENAKCDSNAAGAVCKN